MKIGIIHHGDDSSRQATSQAIETLQALGFDISATTPGNTAGYDCCISLQDIIPATAADSFAGQQVNSLVERILQNIPFDFDQLVLLVEGESKIIKYWTDKVVIEKFKPTVYSFTHNRYGLANGTDNIRIKFTAALYRKMAAFSAGEPYIPRSVFLAEIQNEQGLFLVQHLVDTCNIETRIKRYHIGSPVHRYKYTEQYPSARTDRTPVTRWSRFDTPVVCFDWRHPLTDENNIRLADEPISDDYAALWIQDMPHAKKMALNTFLWLESLFSVSGIMLIDMCIFIDRSGKLIYGEISPDCMRIRWNNNNPELAESMDKDLWRKGAAPEKLYENYEKAYSLMFSTEQG